MILKKVKAAYEFSGGKEKILFMDDLKLYSRIEKEWDLLVQTIPSFSKDRNGVWYRKVCNVSGRERKDCEVSCYIVDRW